MEVFDRNIEEQAAHFKQIIGEERLTRFRAEFLLLHNYDQGRIFSELEEEERHKVYQYLSPDELANVFDALEAQDEKIDEYFEEMSHPYAASVLSRMYADNAVDVLNSLSDRSLVNVYMQLMPGDSAREISRLIQYADDTAGAIMTTEFIAIQEEETLDEAYEHIRLAATEAEQIYYIYVIDQEDRLTGVISLRDLLLKDRNHQIKDIMNTRVLSVQVNTDPEEVARMVQDYDLLALPVVGFDNELLGIITVDDILDVMVTEADSDYSGLAAVDVTEVHQSPGSAAKGRLPWLITLLFLGIGTSTLISHFDGLIAEVSILSAFVTLITGTAGNAGTQSLAVAVRKLSNKDEEDVLSRSVIFELLTGIITGLIVGIAVFLIVGLWQNNWILGFIVAISMFGAITVANLAGALIPKLMDRLGFDPAVASGPFITTFSDLTSVFIYFTIAQQFLPLLQ